MKKSSLIASIEFQKSVCDFYLESPDNSMDNTAKKFNVCSTTVFNILKKNNIQIRSRKALTYNEEQEIVSLYKDKSKKLSESCLSKMYKVSRWTIGDVLDRNGVQKNLSRYRTNVDEHFLDTLDTDCKLWVLGWFFSDGCVTGRNQCQITAHNKDIGFLQKLKEIFKSEYPISSPRNKNCSVFRFASDNTMEKLISYGCVKRKSLIIKYPDFFTEPHQHWSFLRGIFEGDGCISLKRGPNGKVYGAYVDIASGSHEFLVSIQNILFSFLGIRTKISSRVNWGISRKIMIMGGRAECAKFLNAIYLNVNPEYVLERKYKLYKELIECHPDLVYS